jgi:RNA exonuclease 1
VTHNQGKHEEKHKLVAIDCEMCRTAMGLELIRISVLDIKGQVVVDQLVKPKNPILDYNTQFTGLTQHDLTDVSTTLADIQQKLKQLLSRDTYILGHSVENDLKVLKLLHKNVLDTSILYPNARGLPYKNALRYLSAKYLGKQIQSGVHDSNIDAVTCLDLLQLKVRNGPNFGDERISDNEEGESMFKVFSDAKVTCAMVDKKWNTSLYIDPELASVCAFPAENDATV